MPEEASSPLDKALDRLLELEPSRRRAYLDEEFKDDPVLCAKLVELLQANEAVDGLMGAAADAAASLREEPRSAEEDGDVPLPLPTHIGPYEIVDRLGAGGMGTVYLARRGGEDLDRLVALKVIGRTGDGGQAQRRFRAEQRILSRLEHPNVARLYEAGIDEAGFPYFVMEHVNGVPVDQYADERHLTVQGRLDLVRQLIQALSYAHRNLVVHRDVKPTNILVTPDGTLKLLDFGVAKLLESDSGEAHGPLTQQGAPLLTPEYASPEQIRGEPVTTAADIYATGVLLYELLTGMRPYEFTSRSPVHIETVVSNHEPRRPSTVAPDGGAETADARSTTPTKLARALMGDLDWIVLKSLRKEPAARYESIQQLGADLDRYLRKEPVLARPPTWGYRAQKFVIRNRAPLAAAAVVFLSLIGGLGATMWQSNRATREAARAERVKDLVVGLFEASDPDEAQGASLTATQLLERGEQTLLSGLDGEPAIRAELMQIVGGIYTSLGEYDRARPLVDSSLALREELGAEEGIAQALAAVGELHYGVGDYDDGEVIARRRLDLRRKLDRGPSEGLGAALTDLATFLSSTAQYEEAEALMLEALDIDRSLGALDKEAEDWNSLGILRTRMGDYDGGIEAGERSLAANLQYREGDHTSVATSLANLAWSLDTKGEYERADSFYMATLEMRRRLLGDDHPHVAIVLNNLATMRQREGRLVESRELHGQALALRRQIFGDDHADVAASLNNLGIVSYYERDYGHAESMFTEALRIFRLHRAEDHPHVLTGVGNLAAVLREQGKLDQSEALFRSTLETRTRILGEDHQDTGGAWNNLGGILTLRGNPRGAEEAHLRAVEIFERVLTEDHPDLANARMSLARSLVDQDRGADALEHLDLACPVYDQGSGPEHAGSAQCRGVLGLALLSAGRPDEARSALTEAASVLEAERPGEPLTTRIRQALDRLPA